MAIDKTDGSGASKRDRKDHWAFYESGKFTQVFNGSTWVTIAKGSKVPPRAKVRTVTFKNKWLKIGRASCRERVCLVV